MDEAVYLSDKIIGLSKRPGKILLSLPVDMSFPRDVTSDEFNSYRREIISFLIKCDLTSNKEVQMDTGLKPSEFDASKLKTGRTEVGSGRNDPNKFGHQTQQQQITQPIVKEKKVGRNDPCPCGSGKKYKQCHGK